MAKITNSLVSSKEIFIENQKIRLAKNKDYVCKILEEIILYDKEKKEILALVVIVEKAEFDLGQLVDNWIQIDICKRKYNEEVD